MRRVRRKVVKTLATGAVPIGLVAAGLLLGCSGADSPAPDAQPGAEGVAETAKVAEPVTRRAEPPSLALPEPGSVLVSLSEWGVTVRANQVSRRMVLAELERSAGFLLKFAPGVRLEELVTIDTVDASLAEVLGNLLEGGSYALYFGVAESGERVLEQVAVGDFSGTDVPAPELAAKIPDKARWTSDRARERPSRNVERDPIAQAERLERLKRRREENFSRIDDDDPAVRADAAEGLPADDETIPALADLAMNDPDAGVRKAAVSALSDADQENTAARGALLGALSDPDPQVVIAALDSIEWIGDASMIPEITPLLQHPNAEVRGAAEITISFIEE
jgi:hypothetical protein